MTRTLINFYRNLSLGKQRFIARILHSLINTPLTGDIYHFIYLCQIKRKCKQFPRMLIIEGCNLCNLRCVMCPYKVMTRGKSTMSMSLYRKIIDDAAHMGMTEVVISGYLEPLLDKFLFERIEYAKSKGMRVGFSTNGTLLLRNDYMKEILSSRLDWIVFSVDGVTKETYEKIRVGAKFEDVVEGVRRLIEKRLEMHLATPEIHVECCVQTQNYAEISTQRKKFFELFKGADVFAFGTVSMRGDEGEHLPRDLAFGTSVRSGRHIYPCRTLFSCIYCLCDGSVALCCIDYDGKVRLGNLNVQTIAEVWESEQYQKIRRLHLEGRGAQMKLCSNCKEVDSSCVRWWE